MRHGILSGVFLSYLVLYLYLYLYLMSESMVATQPENTLVVPQLFGTAKVAPAAEAGTQLHEGSERQKVRS